MKRYLTRRQRENLAEETLEETLILKAKLQPNESVIYNDRALVVKYALVIEGVLNYFLQGKKNCYFVPESVLIPPDQIKLEYLYTPLS